MPVLMTRKLVYQNICGLVDKIGVEAAALDLFGRHAAGELVDDRGDHLDMGKLFRADVREHALHLRVGHRIALL